MHLADLVSSTDLARNFRNFFVGILLGEATTGSFSEVGKMSKHIQQYFNGLAGKVITKHDVEKCFEELSAKRRRVDPAASSGSDSGSDPWTQVY